jgi:hypothetical protein
MAITIDIPAELESTLRRLVADLDRAAKEAFLVELYRERRLTHAQLTSALGVSALAAGGSLKRHAAYLEMTADDVTRESGELRKLRGDHADRR